MHMSELLLPLLRRMTAMVCWPAVILGSATSTVASAWVGAAVVSRGNAWMTFSLPAEAPVSLSVAVVSELPTSL